VEQDKWTELIDADLPDRTSSIKLLAVERRYIFGLTTMQREQGMRLIKLDTWNIKKGWIIEKIVSEIP